MSEAGLERLLRTLPLFSGLDGPVLEEIGEAARPFALDAGEVLFRQGDRADGMYLVGRGALLVSSRTVGDDTVELARIEEGAILGELGLIDGEPRAASATAEADTEGWFLSRRRFGSLQSDGRPGAVAVMDRIATEVAHYLRADLAAIVAEPALGALLPRPGASAPAAAEDRSGEEARPLLAGLPLFEALEERELAELLELAERVDLPAGEIALVEGEREPALLLVVRGALQGLARRSGGAEQVGVYGPGAIAGAAERIDGGPALATLLARDGAVLLRVDRSGFETLRAARTPLGAKLVPWIHRELARELRRVNRHLARVRVTRRFNQGGGDARV